jgi:hypothetical protein
MTTIRPAREADIEKGAELLNEHSRRIQGTDDITPADLLMYSKSPDVALGRALLRHTFAEFVSRGFRAVGLGVDAENATGAVQVYERAGMHVERTNLIVERSKP